MTTNSSSCMLLPSSLQIRGGPVGKGGHNSDEALVAAGSYQVTRRPTRPPLDEQSGDEPPGPTGLGKDTDGQLHGRSGPKQARPHPASSLTRGSIGLPRTIDSAMRSWRTPVSNTFQAPFSGGGPGLASRESGASVVWLALRAARAGREQHGAERTQRVAGVVEGAGEMASGLEMYCLLGLGGSRESLRLGERPLSTRGVDLVTSRRWMRAFRAHAARARSAQTTARAAGAALAVAGKVRKWRDDGGE